MALLVATRLAGIPLEAVPATKSGEHLPALFPSLEHVERLNRTPPDAKVLILDAERYLTYMAIPFVLTVYATFAIDAIRLMRVAGLDARTDDPNRLMLSELHPYVEGLGLALPQEEKELFDFIRLIRNRIVHYRGIEGSALRSSFFGMHMKARTLWNVLAGGNPPLGTPKEELGLEAKDLIPALAVTKRLGEVINLALTHTVPADVWADVAVEDFMQASEPVAPHQRQRKLVGYARFLYGDLGLDETALKDALDRYLEGEKGGSSY
jgi:hypothetical protein